MNLCLHIQNGRSRACLVLRLFALAASARFLRFPRRLCRFAGRLNFRFAWPGHRLHRGGLSTWLFSPRDFRRSSPWSLRFWLLCLRLTSWFFRLGLRFRFGGLFGLGFHGLFFV